MAANPSGTVGKLNRRTFLKASSLALGGCGLAQLGLTEAWAGLGGNEGALTAADLPRGSAPKPVPLPHFPDRLHAFIWRNWQLVPARRLGEVVGASVRAIVHLGRSMGLKGPPRITLEQQRRAALSIIKRNWHLLPYEQLLQLLGWTPEQMAFTLREDDFLWVKLGNLKPQCERLRYSPPDAPARARAREIAGILRAEFPAGVGELEQPLFEFVKDLSRSFTAAEARVNALAGVRPSSGAAMSGSSRAPGITTPARDSAVAAPGDGRTPALAALPGAGASAFSPRFCYSYFALYGDPLLDTTLDPYPDGYLARLAAAGVDGVWLQAVLTRLAPFPWDTRLSRGYETRLKNLRELVQRAGRHGVSVYLYLNEPRACPASFFATRSGLKGVAEGDYAALCTSVPEVREYLSAAVATICRAAPGLGGFFTISGSENLTNCWSHGGGGACPRCGKRPPAEVIAEVNGTFYDGIRRAGTGQKLIVWDWGWHDDWVEGTIARLPPEAWFMSVSEWGMPISRGGVSTAVGEYSISSVGPGERARRNWGLARARGLRTVAKMQCGNTWELSAVPYIPALANVARHAANLRQAGVNGLMLGWTLGGYPSPNLEVVTEIGATNGAAPDPDRAMLRVAEHRFGPDLAPDVVEAWQEYSAAFSEFPFHGSLVYSAPLQVGPANLLWAEPTGYHASMVGFPYDDLDAWRAVYPAEVFISQFEKVADGFERAHGKLAGTVQAKPRRLSAEQKAAAEKELNVGEAAGLHFRSVANQARFILARRRLKAAKSPAEAGLARMELEGLLRAELVLARRLHAVQSRDSRIGFEASNQYYYVPVDLAEKVINCLDLMARMRSGVREEE